MARIGSDPREKLSARRRIGQTVVVAFALRGVPVRAAVLALALLAPSARSDARGGDRDGAVDATAEAIDTAHAVEPLVIAPPRPGDAVLDERVEAGRHWRLDTSRGAVHIWIPDGYDPATAAAVVFVHGYWISVDDAWDDYRLPQQFALSGINAMFIAPEAPTSKWRSIAWPSLGELIRSVGQGVDVAMPARRLVVAGHSGAYRTIAAWLGTPALDTVILLDALYVDSGVLPWMRQSADHRLVNIVYETGRVSNYVHSRLPGTLRVEGLPGVRLPPARVLYVRTDVGHWELVTGGVALPLALRAIDVPAVASAPIDLPLGLSPRPAPAEVGWSPPQPFATRITEPSD